MDKRCVSGLFGCLKNKDFDNLKSMHLSMKIQAQKYSDLSTNCKGMVADRATAGITGYDRENEQEWLLQSLQEVCGRLRENQVYNQEITEIVA